MKKATNYIIMADMKSSRRKSGPEAKKMLKALVAFANKKHGNKILSPLTITLGDEFQGLSVSAEAGIELIISIEEEIIRKNYAVTLRYVLCEGVIETRINKKIAYGMLGEGLTRAREILNTLKSNDANYQIVLSNSYKAEILNNLFFLFQHIHSAWKQKDYPLITSFIKLEDYKKVAAALGKDTSLMWRRAKSLRIAEYHTLKNTILTFLQHGV